MDVNVEGYKIRKWCEFFEEACSNESGISADGLPVAKFGVGEIGRAHVRTPVTEKSRMPSSA